MQHHSWTKPYRDVIEQQFRVDDSMRTVLDDFFSRLDQMAADSDDQTAFAQRFMASPLYTEYTDLFQKYSRQIVNADGMTSDEQKASLEKQALKAMPAMEAKAFAEREANRIVSQMLPDEVNHLRWAGLKALPVIGPILDWMDDIFQLKRIFRR